MKEEESRPAKGERIAKVLARAGLCSRREAEQWIAAGRVAVNGTTVTTARDPQGRPTVFSVLPPDLPRVVSIGRLDINTEGLLLLTNDGGLARILELPDTGWMRRYRVRAHGSIDQAKLD